MHTKQKITNENLCRCSTLNFWILTAFKIEIDSLVSFLQVLKWPAHIRVCMETSLKIEPDTECTSPITPLPLPNAWPKRQGKAASWWLPGRSYWFWQEGRQCCLLHRLCRSRLRPNMLLVLVAPEFIYWWWVKMNNLYYQHAKMSNPYYHRFMESWYEKRGWYSFQNW